MSFFLSDCLGTLVSLSGPFANRKRRTQDARSSRRPAAAPCALYRQRVISPCYRRAFGAAQRRTACRWRHPAPAPAESQHAVRAGNTGTHCHRAAAAPSVWCADRRAPPPNARARPRRRGGEHAHARARARPDRRGWGRHGRRTSRGGRQMGRGGGGRATGRYPAARRAHGWAACELSQGAALEAAIGPGPRPGDGAGSAVASCPIRVARARGRSTVWSADGRQRAVRGGAAAMRPSALGSGFVFLRLQGGGEQQQRERQDTKKSTADARAGSLSAPSSSPALSLLLLKQPARGVSCMLCHRIALCTATDHTMEPHACALLLRFVF